MKSILEFLINNHVNQDTISDDEAAKYFEYSSSTNVQRNLRAVSDIENAVLDMVNNSTEYVEADVNRIMENLIFLGYAEKTWVQESSFRGGKNGAPVSSGIFTIYDPAVKRRANDFNYIVLRYNKKDAEITIFDEYARKYNKVKHDLLKEMFSKLFKTLKFVQLGNCWSFNKTGRL